MTTTDDLRALEIEAERLLGNTLLADTEYRIAVALDSYHWPDAVTPRMWSDAHQKVKQSKLDGAPRSDYLFLWDLREGTSWEEEINRYVAEWRADPRPFATDLNLCMTVLWPKLRVGVGKGAIDTYSISVEDVIHADFEDYWRITTTSSEWIEELHDFRHLYTGPKCKTINEAILRAFVGVCREGK